MKTSFGYSKFNNSYEAERDRRMIEVVHVGLGPLGQMMVRSAVERGCFHVVGAVDTDPAKIGKDLGELCGMARLGIPVCSRFQETNGRQ
jgi:hypothetical protein